MTEAPASIMYASIVSRETGSVTLMVVALNDLEVKLSDILNPYVQAPVTEECGLIWVQSLVKMLERLQ